MGILEKIGATILALLGIGAIIFLIAFVVGLLIYGYTYDVEVIAGAFITAVSMLFWAWIFGAFIKTGEDIKRMLK